MTIRPHLRAAEVLPGDRLLSCDSLDPDRPGPALPVVVAVTVGDQEVRLTLAGWSYEPVVPADAKVVVERTTDQRASRGLSPSCPPA